MVQTMVRALPIAVLVGVLGMGRGGRDAAVDPQPLDAGGVPGPLVALPVRIAQEDLRVELPLEEVRIQAALLLHNGGRRRRSTWVSPCAAAREEALVELTCDTRLQARAGGRAVPAAHQEPEGQALHLGQAV